MTYNNSHDRKLLKDALKKLTQARMNFQKMKNTVGNAICSLAIAKLYFEKCHEFNGEMEENQVFFKAHQNLKKALSKF